MQENWRNKEGKQMPRIEVVRDTINRKITRWQKSNSVKKDHINNIDIFCIGFGFRYPRYIEYDIQTCEEDQPLQKKEKIEIIDLICDLLALSEILPTQEELTDFRERLNQKWYQCAGYIFDEAKIVEDVYADLFEYIQETMYSSSMRLFHPNALTTFSRRLGWLSRWLAGYLEKKEEKIRNTSYRAAKVYADAVAKQAEDDLNKNKNQYVALIENSLEQFIASYVADVLQALTLGFTPSEIVNDLDEQLALSLAKQIYIRLDEEVKKHIIAAIALQQQILKVEKWSILAQLDMKKVTHLTRRFVQKYAWDFLSPLIDNTVYTMLTQQFENQAKQSFSHWLRLASTREVTRPLAKISTLLPAVFKESVYSEEVMFGASPFRQALDQAAARFIDERYGNHRKILLIISDGEFREDAQVMVSANLLKRRGVIFISGLIHKKNLLAQFIKEAPAKWPAGARRMLDLASEITEQDQTSLSQNKHLTKSLVNKKLCYQLNHSILLEELLENLFEVKPPLSDDSKPKAKKRLK
jgi:hypothetical protein